MRWDPLVYDELRGIARRCLAAGSAIRTLQPTALAREAYLRLANRDSLAVLDRAAFYCNGRADDVRKEQAAQRGGLAITLSLDQHLSDHEPETDFDLLVLDDAMKQLASLDAGQCKVLELRFFDRISIEDTAEVFEISQATAKRECATARVWLHHTLSKGAIVP
jgi:RNA polymerase sigma factor (TIGR02999 family)